MKHPNYNEVIQKGAAIVAGTEHEVRHVENFVGGNFEDPLAAPVTEIVTIKLKEGVSMDDLKEHVRKLDDVLRKSTGCHEVVLGECREHSDTLINLLGWDSVEVHVSPSFRCQY
jgi:hypothetical protein